MRRSTVPLLVCLLGAGAAPAMAQATYLPSFLAPYRAFERTEFGVALSFSDDASFALEGQYRLSAQQFDVGLRGGFVDPDRPTEDAYVVFGVEGRQRVITHSEDFPLDGAVILGVGGIFRQRNEFLNIPVGLSLGRRLDVEDSEVSIIPYVEPTLFVRAGDVRDHVQFALGIGADFRLSRRFDARISAAVGDLEGLSIAAVWVR